jgi:predicted membrane-bound spermidine synthase
VSHEEFVQRFRQGRVRVQVDRAAAARMMSGRLLLPFVLLPLLGLGVALALAGRLFTGIAVFAAALGVRLLVHASSRGFVLTRSLQDAGFYEEMRRTGILVLAAC